MEKKIKVLHMVHGLSIGGAEALVKDYALMLDKSKFDVSILCFFKYGSYYEEIIEKNNIKIYYIYNSPPNKKSKLKSLFRVIYLLYMTKKLVYMIEPDIIHSHVLLNAYLRFVKPRKGTVLIHSVHSEPKRYWDEKSLSVRLDYSSAKWLIKNYGMKLIALHEKMKAELDDMFSVNDTIVLHNGIDYNRFYNLPSKEAERKILRVKENVTVYGHVGRFVSAKNHIFLIEIFHEIAMRDDTAFFILVGTGPEKEIILEKASEYGMLSKCLFLENRSDVPEIMCAMDFFIFPSVYEGLSLTIVEAQKVGLKCFVSEAIDEETDSSNLVHRISLTKSASEWARIILNTSDNSIEYYSTKLWDMSEIVQKLGQIYINSCKKGAS